jgi:hypothetical protein
MAEGNLPDVYAIRPSKQESRLIVEISRPLFVDGERLFFRSEYDS